MNRSLASFSSIISLLILFANPIGASTNCDTLHLINGKRLLITEHKFHDNKFHFYICDDELLEEKHIIDRKSIVEIAAYPVKEKEVVKATKKVKRKRAKKKIKKKKRLKYNAYLELKNGGKIKGRLYSRTSYEVTIKLDGELKRYSFSDLESLKIQKKNKVFRGITGGVLTGLGLGIIIYSGGIKSSRSGYVSFPGQKESIVIAAVSTAVGTIVTVLIIKAKVEIPLNRKNKKRYKFKF